MQKIKDFIYFNRKEIIIVAILLIVFLSYIIITSNEVENYNDEVIIEANKEPEVFESLIIIDIKGEVKTPGTYEFDDNKRVIDAINEAGGLTKNADTSNINLSEKLSDEMLIVIPSIEEVASKEYISENNTAANSQTKVNDGKISINTASVAELTKLSGIGESKARSIVEYRELNGKFKSIEEIKKVSGIGSSTFEKIKNNIKI